MLFLEVVLAACKDFIETDDNEVMEGMLLREYEIYCKNQERFFMDGTAELDNAQVKALESVGGDEPKLEAPDLLVTAVAALVDMGLEESQGAVLVASYIRGNEVVRNVYENYIEHGDTEGFFQELKWIANDAQFMSSRALATPCKYQAPPGFDVVPGATTTSEEAAEKAFKEALKIIKKDDTSFGSLEISAIKLASVRKDLFLSNALAYYIESNDIETLRRDLLYVASKIIHETEISLDIV